MKTINLAAVIGALALTLTACGGGDGDNNDYGGANQPSEGHYLGKTVMNGYDVTNDFIIDKQGNFLGLSFNNVDQTNPKYALTITKGNVNGSKMYEFDMVNSSINLYNASARKQSSDQIIFNFSNLPSSLIRPKTVTAERSPLDYHNLNDMIGVYNTFFSDLVSGYDSVLNVSATNNPSELKVTVTESSGKCKLTGTISRRSYQYTYSDFKGTFTGVNCFSDGEAVSGYAEYDIASSSVFIYGTTNNNNNGFAVLP